MMKFLRLLFFLSFISFCFVACNKDEDITFDPNARLNFSTDSVLFDTVFTSIGSTVRRFKIFNFNEKAINIENIKVAGGANSPFSVNIGGKAMVEGSDLKINGSDSLNVLVRVNINPDNQQQPFIVQDSILFFYNGKKEKIELVAYGQNAIFINNSTISVNTQWDSKLPYIIYNNLTVEPNTTLNIQPGVRVLFHKGATLNIKGTLEAIGTRKDTILFASDRTERIYEEEPGQWNGIHLHESSKNSIINYATIKNAIQGITTDSLSEDSKPKLILANSVVKNMQIVGFLGYHTSLKAYNNLFYNCGQYLMYAIGGGEYELIQNTFAAYNYNFARRTPGVFLSDFISDKEYAGLNISAYNNIIYGSLENELTIEKKSKANSIVDISNNLIKTTSNNIGSTNILNADPLFLNVRQGNFQLKDETPAEKKGQALNNHSAYTNYLSTDILGQARTFPSTLGCYEKK